jgi:hypothetical protein
MLLYKFRPLSNLEFILDILVNERLYCAPYCELNDPFEGQFFLDQSEFTNATSSAGADINPYTGEPVVTPKVTHDVEILSFNDFQHRICSLSESFSSVQLWSLYAEGHAGIAIEIDFTGFGGVLKPVNYVEKLASARMSFLGESVETVLTTKTKHWAYEEEQRVIFSGKYLPIPGRIKRVLVGTRACPDLIALLKKITGDRYPYLRGNLDGENIKVEFPTNKTV